MSELQCCVRYCIQCRAEKSDAVIALSLRSPIAEMHHISNTVPLHGLQNSIRHFFTVCQQFASDAEMTAETTSGTEDVDDRFGNKWPES